MEGRVRIGCSDNPMMRMRFNYFLVLLPVFCDGLLYAQQAGPVVVEPGVSYSLARYRKEVISDVQYNLLFRVPAEKKESITASEIIAFSLKSSAQDLQLDFKQPAERIKTLAVNGAAVAVNARGEHLIVDKKHLQGGANKIAVEFVAGDASLNRNNDYLYALFVPDHARTVFPCFDQPDLKARFGLTLQVPTGWAVLANAVKKDSAVEGALTTYHFAASDELSTYLFSFTAGKYSNVVKRLDGRVMEFLHRETDSAKIAWSVDSIFVLHQAALRFLETYTGIPFPFQKVGFAAVPDFQFGGMEHPGEVQYKASSLFLDETATKDMQVARINLISHETAHMWFGDLVTMRWFNDVWMKEVFANFMADKVTESLMGSETFGLKFLQDHYPAAYNIDRTQGTHPIRQTLANLQEAGSLYGNIIYHKAPIMMRQLEGLMGKAPFRAGLQEYLKTYAFGNADWPQLIDILSKRTPVDLRRWNRVWVNQPGRPVLDYTVAYSGNKVRRLLITQQDESGRHRVWPQAFAVSFVYPDGLETIPVRMKGASLQLREAKGLAKPLCILFNSDGLGYGLFPVHGGLTQSVYDLPSPLQRASAYITLYENMLAGRSVPPEALLNLFTRGVTTETNEMNLRLLTGYLTAIYWEFLSRAKRQSLTQKLEDIFWKAIQQQTAPNNKKILFKAFQEVYGTAAGQERMYAVWQAQQPPAGVKLSEDDYTSLALTLALKSDTATRILQAQEGRIKNEDRKKRIEFLMPALSPDVIVRNRFFYSLRQRSNREKEAWVITALSYLHHPLRQQTSIKYLPESLNLLEEIQRTGDIFFPQSWLGATFGNYQSAAAAAVVKAFLKAHPAYNPKLKNKILQAADNLFRAEKIVQVNGGRKL